MVICHTKTRMHSKESGRAAFLTWTVARFWVSFVLKTLKMRSSRLGWMSKSWNENNSLQLRLTCLHDRTWLITRIYIFTDVISAPVCWISRTAIWLRRMETRCWRVRSLRTINSVNWFSGRGRESALTCPSAVDYGAVKTTRKTTAVERNTCHGLTEPSAAMVSGVRKVNAWLATDRL